MNRVLGIVRTTFGETNHLNLSLELNMVNISTAQGKVANCLRNIKFSQRIIQADDVAMFSKLLVVFVVYEEQLASFSGGIMRDMLV